MIVRRYWHAYFARPGPTKASPSKGADWLALDSLIHFLAEPHLGLP